MQHAAQKKLNASLRTSSVTGNRGPSFLRAGTYGGARLHARQHARVAVAQKLTHGVAKAAQECPEALLLSGAENAAGQVLSDTGPD
jgi:hypothetical protein